MKKLLTIISAVTLTATGAVTLVSCNNAVTPPNNEDNEISFQALMSSKTNEIFNGSVNVINTESKSLFEEAGKPIDLNESLAKFLTQYFWNDDAWLKGFLEKPTQNIQLDNEITFVFNAFEIKNEFKNQKQIILDSKVIYGDESTKITHGSDEYIIQ